MKKIKLHVLLSCLAAVLVLTWVVSGFALVQASGEVNQIPAPKIRDISITTHRIAFVGNSFFYFNNGITSYFSPMVKEGLPMLKVSSAQITIGGASLDWHDMESYLRPNGIYSSSADPNSVVSPHEKLFDVVIMHDNSQGPIHPALKNLFVEYAKKHCDTIRRHGAIPVLFMTWAYSDKPEMTEQLAAAYTKVGNDNGILVIPAGLAFARSVAERPDITLITADKKHPTPAGTYLSAATIYAALFKKSPAGLKYNGGLDNSVARHLQKVAWETCQAYYSQK
jgi:hypothetical protein